MLSVWQTSARYGRVLISASKTSGEMVSLDGRSLWQTAYHGCPNAEAAEFRVAMRYAKTERDAANTPWSRMQKSVYNDEMQREWR